jgi:hypothetical protein
MKHKPSNTMKGTVLHGENIRSTSPRDMSAVFSIPKLVRETRCPKNDVHFCQSRFTQTRALMLKLSIRHERWPRLVHGAGAGAGA